MDIGLLQEINKLPEEIKTSIKTVGDDCFDCVCKWNKENSNQPIENPIEKDFLYGNKIELLKSLKVNCYLSITKLYLQDCCIAAGCNVPEVYLSTDEIIEQACCSYKTAVKWASKHNIKKCIFGKKLIYQWTIEDLDTFIER